MNKDQIARWQANSPRQQFLNALGKEFKQAPKVAQAILADAEKCLLGPEESLKTGQITAPHGGMFLNFC